MKNYNYLYFFAKINIFSELRVQFIAPFTYIHIFSIYFIFHCYISAVTYPNFVTYETDSEDEFSTSQI